MDKSNTNNSSTVLAVDLDGTLVLTDTFHESLLKLIKSEIWLLLLIPFWMFRGKAYVKSKVSEKINLDISLLPFNKILIQWIVEQKNNGKKIVLATAADQKIANGVAEHLKIFDEIIASNGKINNSNYTKCQFLNNKYGVGNWDYAGNEKNDLDVWKHANFAIVVNASKKIIAKAKMNSNVSKVFPRNNNELLGIIKAMRLHQWSKNILIFVPIVAAHQVGNLEAILTLIIAFISFSLCASAVYIWNDLLDLDSDRIHPRKRLRPFASGVISIKIGVLLIPFLMIASLLFGIWVGYSFVAWLLLYFIVTTAYTIWIKRIVLIDCIALSFLYTLRIIAGAVAVGVETSFWLLAFSIFIFLSLAYVKRFIELQSIALEGKDHAHGRGYIISDAPLLKSFGIGAGYSSALVLALYMQSDNILSHYKYPMLMWFEIVIIIYWIGWIWIKANRMEMSDDPIIFAVKDRISQLLVLAFFAVIFLAS